MPRPRLVPQIRQRAGPTLLVFRTPGKKRGNWLMLTVRSCWKMKTIFRKKFWVMGRRRGRSGSKGHTMELLVFPHHMGGGHCWVRGGKSAKTGEVLVFWPCQSRSFMFAEVQTSLGKLEKKQILGLFTLEKQLLGLVCSRGDVTRTRWVLLFRFCFFLFW